MIYSFYKGCSRPIITINNHVVVNFYLSEVFVKTLDYITVKGYVLDTTNNNAPVKEANILFSSGLSEYNVFTDCNGFYEINLPSNYGCSKVIVYKDGYYSRNIGSYNILENNNDFYLIEM